MEIFLVLIVVGVLWFITKLINGGNPNVLSNSKYKNDLAKQEKELEEQRKIYGSNPVFPETPKKPEIKKGKRGGRYTEDKTKDGRPYRRYF
tara:strand:- start:99 stop:371 length:273 start_codon:yes stop_codon:yes gene_type:complete